MRLREFVSSKVVSAAGMEKKTKDLVKLFNKNGVYLSRYGGQNRVLQMMDNPKEKIIIFSMNDKRMFGISAGGSPGDSGDISKIYVWNEFYGTYNPDFTIHLPLDIEPHYYIKALIGHISRPVEGEYNLSLNEGLLSEMATRTTEAEFVALAKHYIEHTDPTLDISKLSAADLNTIAAFGDVQLPQGIRFRYSPNRTSYWDLSEVLGPDEYAMSPEEKRIRDLRRKDIEDVAGTEGGEVDHDYKPEDEADEEIRQKIGQLGKLGKDVDILSALNKKKRLVITGRNANGGFMSIAKMGVDIEASLNALSAIINKQLKLGLDSTDDGDMIEQMDEMKRYIRGVIGGTSQTAHSVILTGAPGTGKTFTVMKTIIEEGQMEEGEDYVVIQGGTTTTKLYERLFVSYDKLIVFDDCDSMWKDAEAVNILKAALQTGDGVRAISRDKAGTIDTAKMSHADRERELYLIRSFYDDPMFWAKEKLKRRFPDKISLIDSVDEITPDFNPYDKGEDFNDWQKFKSYMSNDIMKPLDTGAIKLPNKIHFEGRIIFISNLDEDDLDDAVKSRATVYNIKVTNQQVVDFVGTIMDKFKHEYVDIEQRQEILDYIHELYTSNIATKQFSIRQFQVSMDLYAMGGNWQKRVAKSLK